MSDSDKATTTRAGKWISRLATAAAIVAVLAGGFALWDHHDYPVKGFGDPRDPFGGAYWPEPVMALGNKLYKGRQQLFSWKRQRVYRRKLANLNFENTRWTISQDPAGFGPHGEISFDSDGTLKISGEGDFSKQPWFHCDKYQRLQEDVIVFLSEDHSYSFDISFFGKGSPILSTRVKTGPGTFTVLNLSLFPVLESSP